MSVPEIREVELFWFSQIICGKNENRNVKYTIVLTNIIKSVRGVDISHMWVARID